MELIMENWRGYSANELLLAEGLNVKDLFMDVIQVAASTGAIAGTGGAGGDTVTDALFATSIAADILEEVNGLLAEAAQLSIIVKSAMKLNYGADEARFYKQVKSLLKRTAASGTLGGTVKDFIKDVQEKVSEIIGKVVRAISKWVATLLPDDFGLSGPAFEATMTQAISATAGNSYDLASKGIAALGETGRLITDPDALGAFLTKMVQSLLGFAQKANDMLQNPDPEKAGIAGSTFGRVKLAAERQPVIALGAWLVRKAGVPTDTLAEDYMQFLQSLHPNDPQRLLYQKLYPKFLSFLEKILDEWIPNAVAVMRKLISILFASIAVFQMIMDPEERKEILAVKTGKADLADPIGVGAAVGDVELSDEDLPGLAAEGQLIQSDMKLIMGNWNQFKHGATK